MLSALLFSVLFLLAGLWIAFGIEGYLLVEMPDPNGVVIPTAKTVETATGAWLSNYSTYPWMMLAPVVGICGAIMVVLFSRQNRPAIAFLSSGLAVAATILTAGLSMFPFVMPFSTEPGHSLTLWDSVSSHFTLALMFWVVVIFLPIVLAYTGWVYRVMRGKVTETQIRDNPHNVY